VLINFVVHVICAKLELQVSKVGGFSIGWFMLADHLVRAHVDFINFDVFFYNDYASAYQFHPNRTTHGEVMTSCRFFKMTTIESEIYFRFWFY